MCALPGSRCCWGKGAAPSLWKILRSIALSPALLKVTAPKVIWPTLLKAVKLRACLLHMLSTAAAAAVPEPLTAAGSGTGVSARVEAMAASAMVRRREAAMGW